MIASAIAGEGLASAVARFERSALRTAQAPLQDLEVEMVERIAAKASVSANIAVLRTADDMTGALLDILA